jgi:5-(carboxyamino)imidazole ribonucleotide mutase
MTAAKTALPVLGVPVESKILRGVDSLLSIVQMPAGVPVGTLGIGSAGAANAALLATAILGNKYPEYRMGLEEYRKWQTDTVMGQKVGLSITAVSHKPAEKPSSAGW